MADGWPTKMYPRPVGEPITVVEYYDQQTGEIWHFADEEPLAAYIPAPQPEDGAR